MVSRRTQQQILFQTSNTDEIPNRTKINRKFVCLFFFKNISCLFQAVTVNVF